MSKDPNDIVQAHLIEEETFGPLVVLENREGKFVQIIPISDLDTSALTDHMHDTMTELIADLVESGEFSGPKKGK
jgi:hypothetical protein